MGVERRGSRLFFAMLIIAFLSVLILTGCWDYRGLEEQTVVVGIAVDLGEEGRGFTLTFEIVDLQGGEGGQFGSVLLTTRGETLVEAVYNAYVKLHSHVHLGVVDVVIVSRHLVEQVGLTPLVDYLIRDKNARNSLYLVVAGTETARELFIPAEEGEGGEEQSPAQDQGQRMLLSKILGESLSPRRRGASSATDARALYEVYHILNRGTSDLTLPIVGPSEAEDIPFQLDGLALFEGDRMSGALKEADMSVYLLAATGVRGRVFPVEVEGQRAVIAVRSSRAEVDFAPEGDALRFFLDIRVTADLIQPPEGFGEPDQVMLRRMEAEAERALAEEITELAGRLRDEGQDILGLAEAVRNRDPRLWERIAGDWRARLQASEIEVWVRVEAV